MIDFPKQYALWDEFITAWPRERLAIMTLDEYNHAGSKESKEASIARSLFEGTLASDYGLL